MKVELQRNAGEFQRRTTSTTLVPISLVEPIELTVKGRLTTQHCDMLNDFSVRYQQQSNPVILNLSAVTDIEDPPKFWETLCNMIKASTAQPQLIIQLSAACRAAILEDVESIGLLESALKERHTKIQIGDFEKFVELFPTDAEAMQRLINMEERLLNKVPRPHAQVSAQSAVSTSGGLFSAGATTSSAAAATTTTHQQPLPAQEQRLTLAQLDSITPVTQPLVIIMPDPVRDVDCDKLSAVVRTLSVCPRLTIEFGKELGTYYFSSRIIQLVNEIKFPLVLRLHKDTQFLSNSYQLEDFVVALRERQAYLHVESEGVDGRLTRYLSDDSPTSVVRPATEQAMAELERLGQLPNVVAVASQAARHR
ncbi:MAG: hypothetical protein A3E83_01255 [Gammaproteobacteria bacterium RIFCSPHIGHO2_12_FULL_41_20]|nr:MAG: hypothetical protein A3E83_01255 [Gammaproteobacteria bacterium RIFCSPHIGHO2_12_FULL_41_20]